MKLTAYQLITLRKIAGGNTMLRGKHERYWWQSSDVLCTAVARRLKSKGLIKTCYLNSVRDTVSLTDAGIAAIGEGS